MLRFRDRRDAGEKLAKELAVVLQDISDAIVLGIPRGGVVVGDVVATRLGLPLDVIAVEKVGAPWNPELAVGAVGEGDALWLDEGLVASLDPNELEAAIERERRELDTKLASIRAVRSYQPLEGRTVVVVDDGIATGATIRAALLALRGARPAASILAVPVGPPETISALTAVADTLVCPLQPAAFYAVGQWYATFGQVSTPEVLSILETYEDAAMVAKGRTES
jgi:putative phosphoribosyl transferase